MKIFFKSVGLVLGLGCSVVSCSDKEITTAETMVLPLLQNQERTPNLSTETVERPQITLKENHEKWKVPSKVQHVFLDMIEQTQRQIDDPEEFDIYIRKMKREIAICPPYIDEMSSEYENLQRFVNYIEDMLEVANGLNIEMVLKELETFDDYFMAV